MKGSSSSGSAFTSSLLSSKTALDFYDIGANLKEAAPFDYLEKSTRDPERMGDLSSIVSLRCWFLSAIYIPFVV